MRSAECKWRVEAASEARAAIPHSAFRIPHSVWWGVGLRILLAGGGTGGHLMPARGLARRARQIRLGFPETRERLRVGSHTAVFALGNPIRVPEPGSRDAALVALGLAPERPTLLVFGGSQGARAINYAVAGALERRLLDEVNVIWGTRTAHVDALVRYEV